MVELNAMGAAAFVLVRHDAGRLVFEQFNEAAERMTGLSHLKTVGRTPAESFPAEVAATLTSNTASCLDNGIVTEFRHTAVMPAGTVTTRTLLTPLFDRADTPPRRVLGVSVDITSQHRLQEQLKSANARLGIAMDALGGAHWYFDSDEQRFELSSGFDRILGPTCTRSLKLDDWLTHVHPEDRDDTCFADILAGRSEQGTAEFRVLADNGDVRWLRCRRQSVKNDQTVKGIAGVVVDITQEKRREAALTFQAASDPLTGLPNRRRFEEVFALDREAAARRREALALLMVDIDHFKAFNDRYGHIPGDAVLKQVANCLGSVVAAEGGTLARYGGEEFIAVLPGRDTAAAAQSAEKLLSAVRLLAVPHAGSPSGFVTVSIGVAGYPSAVRVSGTDLIGLADAALYRAKNDGRDRYRVMVAPHMSQVVPETSAA